MNLKIRKMRENDLEPLYKLLSDSNVMRFLEKPFSKNQTLKFLKEAGMREPPLIYAVEKDGCFIGYVIFHDYDNLSYEIGWALYQNYWGKGYASYLTKLLIEKAFKMNKQVVIECDSNQEVTKHIAAKFGLEYSGIKDGLEIYRSKLFDSN